MNKKRKQFESRIFDCSTIEGLAACEKYLNRLYSLYENVKSVPVGLNRVQVVGRN